MYIYIYIMYIYIYIYIGFRLLPLSIYLHKTVTISKNLQFSIYKLSENIGT